MQDIPERTPCCASWWPFAFYLCPWKYFQFKLLLDIFQDYWLQELRNKTSMLMKHNLLNTAQIIIAKLWFSAQREVYATYTKVLLPLQLLSKTGQIGSHYGFCSANFISYISLHPYTTYKISSKSCVGILLTKENCADSKARWAFYNERAYSIWSSRYQLRDLCNTWKSHHCTADMKKRLLLSIFSVF